MQLVGKLQVQLLIEIARKGELHEGRKLFTCSYVLRIIKRAEMRLNRKCRGPFREACLQYEYCGSWTGLANVVQPDSVEAKAEIRNGTGLMTH